MSRIILQHLEPITDLFNFNGKNFKCALPTGSNKSIQEQRNLEKFYSKYLILELFHCKVGFVYHLARFIKFRFDLFYLQNWQILWLNKYINIKKWKVANPSSEHLMLNKCFWTFKKNSFANAGFILDPNI